jgi:hypothetical protein
MSNKFCYQSKPHVYIHILLDLKQIIIICMTILVIIHRPVFYLKHYVSETVFCLYSQVPFELVM